MSAVDWVFSAFVRRDSRPPEEKPAPSRGFNRWLAILVFGMVLAFIWFTCVIVVPAGSVGVQDTFGVVSDDVLQSGLHIKSPFTDVVMMSTRTMKYIDYGSADTATITALSNDGLSTTMGIAVNYHIDPTKAPEIYKTVGTDYQGVVMVNPIHSVPRDLISKYDTKTLYSASQEGSTDRAKLESELLDGIQNGIDQIGVKGSIIVERVSIRNIDFPPAYKDSITSKMNMDTDKQKKATEVELQRLEAQRKVVEAEGDATANIARATGDAESTRIRNAQAPSDAVLALAWIQAMKDNPKAIYVPVGSNGIPLFKNVDGGE